MHCSTDLLGYIQSSDLFVVQKQDHNIKITLMVQNNIESMVRQVNPGQSGIIACLGKIDRANTPSVYVIDLQTISPLLRISSFLPLQTPRVSCLTIEYSPRHHPHTFSGESAYANNIAIKTA